MLPGRPAHPSIPWSSCLLWEKSTETFQCGLACPYWRGIADGGAFESGKGPSSASIGLEVLDSDRVRVRRRREPDRGDVRLVDLYSVRPRREWMHRIRVRRARARHHRRGARARDRGTVWYLRSTCRLAVCPSEAVAVEPLTQAAERTGAARDGCPPDFVAGTLIITTPNRRPGTKWRSLRPLSR